MNPLAVKLADDIIRELTKQKGAPPPGFKERLVEVLSQQLTDAPHSGLIVIGACICRECQDFRVEAFRIGCEMAERLSLEKVMQRNAASPCMN